MQQPIVERISQDAMTFSDYLDQAKLWLGHVWADPLNAAYIVGVPVALGVGALTNWLQNRKADVMPVLFSDESGLPQTPAVQFYDAVNDATMTVLDRWNDARASRSYSGFAEYLGDSPLALHIDTARKAGGALLEELALHAEIAGHLKEAEALLDRAWSYRSEDNTHTEITPGIEWYLEDGKMKSRPTVNIEEVYDDTDHYFTFDRDAAIAAKEHLDAALRSTDLFDPGLTNLEILATEQDRASIGATVLEDEATVGDDVAQEYVNMWLRTAVAGTEVPKINDAIDKLRAYATSPVWEAILGSEPSYHYNTTDRSHKGPEGYRKLRGIARRTEGIPEDIRSVRASITKTLEHLDELAKINATAHTASDPKAVASEAVRVSVDAYQASFPGSRIDVDQQVNHELTVVAALGAGILSAYLAYNIQSGGF